MDTDDLWVMLICTVRYSLGRQTYMTALAPELCLKYKAALSPQHRKQICEEVKSEIDRAEAAGKTVGGDIDHKSWKDFLEKFQP